MYVPPVTNTSVGKFKYVVADIVVAVKPLVKVVPPVTVPPLKGRKSPDTPVDPVKLIPKFGYVPFIPMFVPPLIVTTWSGNVFTMVTRPLVVFAEIPVPPVTPLTGKF